MNNFEIRAGVRAGRVGGVDHLFQRGGDAGAFRALPSIDDAGRLVGFTLGGLHWLGVTAAVVYLVATLGLGRSLKTPAQLGAGGVI